MYKSNSSNQNDIIAKKYKVLALVGKGQFGEVNKGSCLKTQKNVAIKMERKDSPYRMLKHEATVLNYLTNNERCNNIPKIFYYGSHGPYMCIVTSFFSEGSLDSLRGEITLEEKIKWWNTAVDILSHVHDAGIVHRDLKPHHFMRNENHEWFLIDFGLASTYLREKDQEHIEEVDTDHIIGSPNYVSWFVHHGKDVVRRDDFLSLIYVFWELVHGSFLTDMDTLPKTRKSTSIHDEFNIWLQNQKEFDRLFRLLSLLAPPEDMMTMTINTFLGSLLSHAQHLLFHEKPNYCKYVELKSSSR